MTLPKENPGSTDPNEFTSEIPEEIVINKHIGSGKPRHRDLPQNRKRGWYSDALKMKVACTYALTGNSRRTSEMTKVPEGTIRAWKSTEWWHEIMSRIREEQNEELDAKLTKLVDKALDAVNDRLENGDYVYNAKTGSLSRKPVSMKDLAIVTAITVDKRQLLRGEPTSRVEKVSENEKLSRLQQEFRKFSEAKEITSQAVEIEEELAEEEELSQEEIAEIENEEAQNLTINEMFTE